MTPHDDRLIFLIGQARQRLYTRLDKALMDHTGVTTAQAGVLFFLSRNDGCLLLALSRGLMLDKSAITRMADRLKKKRLIERRPSQEDGRAVLVFLTKAGRRATSRCLAIVKAHNDAIKEGYSPAEIESFSRILQTTVQRFTEE